MIQYIRLNIEGKVIFLALYKVISLTDFPVLNIKFLFWKHYNFYLFLRWLKNNDLVIGIDVVR